MSEADEVDDQDEAAIHLLLSADEGPIGTARLILGQGYVKIGRVCVLKSARGHGHGAALIRAAVEIALTLPGVRKATLCAQTHALGFYEALGFTAVGPEFFDAGIAHREMVLGV